MTQPRPAAASARARLLKRARARDENYQRVLVRYALERLLYRLSISEYAGEFILKGAMLFALWGEKLEHRPTKDADLLGSGTPSPERLASVFREICEVAVDVDDGLDFDADSVVAEAIREDAIYDGLRVVLRARLGSARLRIQVDVGYGDAVTPGPVSITYPTLLDHPAPKLDAYPAATVVAEKLEAMVALSITNSRMKDFFDVAWCAEHLDFDGAELVAAVQATFERRGTAVPSDVPIALTPGFAGDESKLVQWAAFTRKAQLAEPTSLCEVVDAVAVFLGPVLEGAAQGGHPGRWKAGGPWTREQLG